MLRTLCDQINIETVQLFSDEFHNEKQYFILA
jgi:hypothetical protein